MSFVDQFETARLRAERLTPDHLELMCRLHRNPTVMATLAGVRTDEETEQFVRNEVAHWSRHGHGLWMLFDKATSEFVGRAGLRRVHVGRNEEIEVGYALVPEYWGRGLATEVTATLVEIGFGLLGMDEIVCFTLPDNRASRRVMEKAGFAYERNITHANLPHVLYRIIRPPR